MSSRRKFLKTAALSSAVLGSGNVFATKNNTFKTIKNNAVVVSTWDFGKTANLGHGRSWEKVEELWMQ